MTFDPRNPLEGRSILNAPSALQRTLTTALQAGAAVAPPELWKPPVVKETPLDKLRTVQNAHPVPTEWEKDLRTISPMSRDNEWLAFRWSEGTPGFPIERWMLYACNPNMSDEWHRLLGGTPWWEMPTDQQAGRRQLVSAYQWEMYRKHRVMARPFWCLQGPDGGTPCAYGELEQKLLRLTQKPTDPPDYGSQPYLPWNGLVKRRIQERRRFAEMSMRLRNLSQQNVAAHLKAESEAAEKQFRVEFLKWIDDRFEAQADFLTWYTRKTEADMVLPKATTEQENIAARAADHFVETGVAL